MGYFDEQELEWTCRGPGGARAFARIARACGRSPDQDFLTIALASQGEVQIKYRERSSGGVRKVSYPTAPDLARKINKEVV
jgi:hypothetical protein